MSTMVQCLVPDELQKGKEFMPFLNDIISSFLISFQALSQRTSCMVLTRA